MNRFWVAIGLSSSKGVRALLGAALLGVVLASGGCSLWPSTPQEPTFRRPSDWLKQPRPESIYQTQ